MTRSRNAQQRVLLPHDLDVQMPSSEARPGGGIVRLRAGVNQVDEEVAEHPIVSRLLIDEDNETVYGHAEVMEAARRRDEKIAQAWSEFHADQVEIENRWADKRMAKVADWDEAREEAMNAGERFDEPHPSAEAQRAAALTAHPAHVYPASMFVTKEGQEKAQGEAAPQRHTRRTRLRDDDKAEKE